MKSAKDQKTTRFSTSATAQDKARYFELLEQYECSHAQLMSYLLSLESSRAPKGAQIVERQLKQWLLLGYDKIITAHELRKESVHNGKTVGLKSVKDIMELYKEEIDTHNAQVAEQ